MKATSLFRRSIPLIIFAFAVACSEPEPETTPDAGASLSLDGGVVADAGVVAADGGLFANAAIAPVSQRLFINEIAYFSLTVEDGAGTVRNITAEATWSVSDAEAFGVKAPGAILVRSAGQTEVRAEWRGLSATAELIGAADDADVVSLRLVPDELELPLGVERDVRCVAQFADGQSREVSSNVTWSVTPESLLSLSEAGGRTRIRASEVGTGNLQAAYGGQSVQAAVTVSAGQVLGLELVPESPTVAKNASRQLRLLGRYAGGAVYDVTADATWSSGDESIFRVVAGLVTGVEEGDATLEVSFGADAAESTPTTLTATVHVSEEEIRSLDVTPANVQLAAGTSANLRATAILGDGTSMDVTEEATWTVEEPSLVELTFVPEGVRVLGVSVAETTLTVTYGDASTLVPVQIRDAVLTEVSLAPAAVALPVGRTERVYFVGTYSDGTRVDLGPTATWTTDDENVALVLQEPPGLIRGEGVGQTNIRASAFGFSASVEVDITNAELVSLHVSPPVIRFPAGESSRLNVFGSFSDSTQRDMRGQVTFSSSSPDIARVSNAVGQKGMVLGIAPGEAEILVEGQGLSDTAQVTISEATIDAFFITPQVFVLHSGFFEQADAYVTYSDGTTLSVADQVVWRSLAPEVAQVSNAAGSKGRVSALSAGEALIEASFQGEVASVPVYVNDDGFEAYYILPFAPLRLAPGATEQVGLFGAYQVNNNVYENLTGWAVWESSDPEVVSVENFPLRPGLVTAHGPGEAVIRATYQGMQEEKAVTVSNVTLESISISPTDVELATDAVQAFVVLAEYSDGTTFDVTRDADFSADDATILAPLDAFIPGLVVALSPGETVLRASFNGLFAETSVEVMSATPTQVVVSPVNPIVEQGEPTQFYATALYDDGTESDVTYLCSWSSDDSETLLMLDEPAAKGLAFGIDVGNTTVRAICLGLEDDTQVTVR